MKTLRNNFYIVKLFCKAAPVKVAAELALCLLRQCHHRLGFHMAAEDAAGADGGGAGI